ncbi:DNA repair and recombination protein RadB [Candidatus Woesearchaeota archaeon]|nr:MAG: DNA repair and recombination protein RadB [Candidatus Woesearchaeota archaeon]
MKETKVSTGTTAMDWLLEGGYEKDAITTIYGPAGSGKTNLCLLCIASSTKKVIYIDTEGSFSIARFKQICPDYKEALKRVVFLNPTTYDEQKKAFELLKKIVDDKVGLIVVDSIAMLYRLELGQANDVYTVNRTLGLQLGYITEIARKRNIPVLITNQVYADFENKEKVHMVGGDLLRYQSKCLIELQKISPGLRKATIQKHRSIEEGKSVIFKIVDEGIIEA